MHTRSTAAADLLAEGASTRQSIAQRIKRRLEVLMEWKVHGVPAGKTVPKSLRSAREWEDPELGILEISSPNEFTTTHLVHGEQVREIQLLANELLKQGRDAADTDGEVMEPPAAFDRQRFDRLLEVAVSQWHAERDRHLEQKRRAESAEGRNALLQQEIKQKDALISELRKQIASPLGLRSVK